MSTKILVKPNFSLFEFLCYNVGNELNKMSESTEMYLETILVIQKKKGHVRSIDIAREMIFSKPTISQQMKKIKRRNSSTWMKDGYLLH